MKNIQDMLSLLPPITAAILIMVGFLTAVIRLIDRIKGLWARLKPAIKYLILFITQIIPVGTVIWYYMYWAVQYSGRFTQPGIFLLLIAEPTVIVIAYELFWGVWLYPKLLSFVKLEGQARQASGPHPNKNNGHKSGSKPAKHGSHK